MTPVRWLFFVAPGSIAGSLAPSDLAGAPLTSDGRRQAKLAARWTEHIQLAVSSPDRRAWETASLIAPSVAVQLDRDLRDHPGRRLRDTGAPTVEGPPGSPADRLSQAMTRLVRLQHWSVLVVADAAVIRGGVLGNALLVGDGVEWLTGQTLPVSCPRPSEVVLTTRQPQLWRLGRLSSSAPAVRPPIDRYGFSFGPA